MNEIIELQQKMFYYLDTFTNNSGRKVAKNIILDSLRTDAVEQKMKELRLRNKARIYKEHLGDVDPYETAAQAFYRKYGTQGEF